MFIYFFLILLVQVAILFFIGAFGLRVVRLTSSIDGLRDALKPQESSISVSEGAQ